LDDYTYEFIPFRGLTRETLRLYDIKSKIDKDGKPVSIGFHYPNGAMKIRGWVKKEFHTQGDIGKAGLFGRDRFAAGSHAYVVITEGEIDAPSLHQVLRVPCVSVQSASSAVRDCTVDRAYLNSFERIYLAFDSDAAGREALRGVAKLFDPNRVYTLNFDTRKDANEFLEHGEEDALRTIWKNSRKYLPDNLISSVSDFKKALLSTISAGVPYPFECLNKMLYGIRPGETVLIKAQEKVGKTEVMHFIEHKLLTETDDNVGAIFLEEAQQRHVQSLVGIQLGRPVHLPDCHCPEDQMVDALQQVVQRDDRLYIHTNFGSNDGEVLLDTIRYLVSARNCRYILFDHLTMACVGMAEEDERRKLDWLSTRLEMMVKELNFALIIVSHVNDMGQTRGSRYPTKVADITIDLSRDLMSDDPVRRRTIDIAVPYNRFCSNTGYAGSIIFDPSTYTFEEVANADPSGAGVFQPPGASTQHSGAREPTKLSDNKSEGPRPTAQINGQGTQEANQMGVQVAANDNSPQGNQRKVA
jgi:twinkle protein